MTVFPPDALPAIRRWLDARDAFDAQRAAMKAAGTKPPDIDGEEEAAIDALWHDHGIDVQRYSIRSFEEAVRGKN